MFQICLLSIHPILFREHLAVLAYQVFDMQKHCPKKYLNVMLSYFYELCVNHCFYLQLQKNALLTLCSDRILQSVVSCLCISLFNYTGYSKGCSVLWVIMYNSFLEQTFKVGKFISNTGLCGTRAYFMCILSKLHQIYLVYIRTTDKPQYLSSFA